MTAITTTSMSPDAPAVRKKHEMPNGLWERCPSCEGTIFSKRIEENLGVCPECDHHFRINARTRINQLCDEGTFEELLSDLCPTDPLKFHDSKPYAARLSALQKKTGLNDAAVCGTGYIRGRALVVAALDKDFMMGSMGSVVGAKIAGAADVARTEGLPLVVVSVSGGARMQEGMLSLTQMALTSAAIGRLDDAGGLFISVLADPTTGGVAASFSMLGDVILAEPRALIGFAGPRVIYNAMKVDLPEGFQRSEFLQEHGFVDRVVHRKDLRSEIARIIDFCGK